MPVSDLDTLTESAPLPRAREELLERARGAEYPSSLTCARLAQVSARMGDAAAARVWALAAVDGDDEFRGWQLAATVMGGLDDDVTGVKRSARLAIVGSSTTTFLVPLLRLAARRRGVALDIREGGYGQYRQDLLEPEGWLHEYAPDFVLVVADTGALSFAEHSEDPDSDLAREVDRWVNLWQSARRAGARVVQTNFVPDDPPFGHLAPRLAGTRYRLVQELNLRLAELAGSTVTLVDCQRLAARIGTDQWFDPRYWNLSKQAIAPAALPLLARELAAVLAGELGLARKCLVLDLDGTLWGGVVAEDGLGGIRLGAGMGTEGEAYVALQESVLALQRTGVVLAVCSKNDEQAAREPFLRHPDMRIRLEDVACFVANWNTKPDNLARIASDLHLGLDALVLLDDNPMERQLIRQTLPEVEVLRLPDDPSLYARAVSQTTLFEKPAFTDDDGRRTDLYRGLAAAARTSGQAPSLEAFWRDLDMRAMARPFTTDDLLRVAQLVAKTNQFNLTTRRRETAELEAVMADPACVHFSVRLRDRFADHGLVAVMIAFVRDDTTLEIDSWLMSCRVIGRTLERAVLAHVVEVATRRGCTQLVGTYVPSDRNALVRDLYPELGFSPVSADRGTTRWQLLVSAATPSNDFIDLVEGGF